MPRAHKIKTPELAQALKDFDGDYEKTAQHFDTTAKKIRERVYHDPQLKSVWVKGGVNDPKPDGIDLLDRQPELDDSHGSKLIKALEQNGKEIFQKDLESLLQNSDNVAKLRIFEEFDSSVGLLMAEALRHTQKVNIMQNTSLFEVTESLKDEINDDRMDPEERILKTRLFLQATEQQGKFYDRLLKGLEFQLKLANEKDKRETKKKPGFRPLKELEDVEETES